MGLKAADDCDGPRKLFLAECRRISWGSPHGWFPGATVSQEICGNVVNSWDLLQCFPSLPWAWGSHPYVCDESWPRSPLTLWGKSGSHLCLHQWRRCTDPGCWRGHSLSRHRIHFSFRSQNSVKFPLFNIRFFQSFSILKQKRNITGVPSVPWVYMNQKWELYRKCMSHL